MSSRLLGWGIAAVGNRLGYRDLDEVRRKVERQRTRPAHFGPPKKLQKSCTVTLSFEHGWPCYEIAPRGRTPVAQVLYLHGGAYVEEVGFNHWALVKELAVDVPARAVVPVYPLAPAGTAQTVLPRLTALARELKSGSCLPVVFAGDSAGGALSLAVAQRLRDEGETTADRLVLISPWLDAVLDDPLLDEIQPHDPMLAVEPLRWAGALWAGALPLSDPSVSPLNGSMTGLPPVQVFTGTRDILLSDARRFRDRAAAAGVSVELHEEAGQVHAYPLWPVTEGRRAREQMLAGIRRSPGRA
ncbi:alpha/beta hydrolase [Streptomyces bathyalis]|uniref:Alpha/beta hydrolase n=1 Tax=Streptomyces bathyalis TaxID=2710756 RepID=A0A7T1T8H7_9ACTN|nr:alpha/beta hydrolase [Streptomyces bathyalis]QPP08357.1 alpha/beta hydrolase [Streptomyces bathyalis]